MNTFKIKRKDTLYEWDKVFENGLSKICGRQPVKNLKGFQDNCA